LRARTAGAYGHRRFHSGISALSETIEAFYLVPVRSATCPSGPRVLPSGRSDAYGERDGEVIGAHALRHIRFRSAGASRHCPFWGRHPFAPLAISRRVRNCPGRADSGHSRACDGALRFDPQGTFLATRSLSGRPGSGHPRQTVDMPTPGSPQPVE
jgi:hypothetical protein